MKPLRSALLTLAVSALSLGGIACQSGTLTEEETLVGEASAALTVAEESGDVTADAVGLESTADLSASAEESAELPPTTTESDGVCDFRVQKQRVDLSRSAPDATGGPQEGEGRANKQPHASGIGAVVNPGWVDVRLVKEGHKHC